MPRIKNVYTITDISRDYKKNYKTLLKSDKLEITEFKEIIKEILKRISIAIIREKYRFKVPLRMGFIFIKQCKANNVHRNIKSIDYHKFKTKGIFTRHFNRHTFGYYFKFFWGKKDKINCQFKNGIAYSFTPIPDKQNKLVGKSGLSSYIFECAKNPELKDYQAHLN